MAKRRVNFIDEDISLNDTVESIMPIHSNQATMMNREGQMITLSREEAKGRKLADYQNINTNQTDVVRGSVKMDFLIKDLRLVHKHFFSTFEGTDTSIDLCGDDPDRNPDYIILNNFPLPDYCITPQGRVAYSPDKEDIIMIINNYPDNGPYGIHVKNGSSNLNTIRKALKGHQYSVAIGEPNLENIGDLKQLGWRWICFHYQGGQWSFNRQNMTQGDCLAKYTENLFAALSGSGENYAEA